MNFIPRDYFLCQGWGLGLSGSRPDIDTVYYKFYYPFYIWILTTFNYIKNNALDCAVNR